MSLRLLRWPILFGIAGLLALAFVIFLMVKVMQNDESDSPAASQQIPQ